MRFSTVVCRMRCWCSVYQIASTTEICVCTYKKNPLHMWFFCDQISLFYFYFFLSIFPLVFGSSVWFWNTTNIPRWWKHQIWSFTVCFYHYAGGIILVLVCISLYVVRVRMNGSVYFESYSSVTCQNVQSPSHSCNSIVYSVQLLCQM